MVAPHRRDPGPSGSDRCSASGTGRVLEIEAVRSSPVGRNEKNITGVGPQGQIALHLGRVAPGAAVQPAALQASDLRKCPIGSGGVLSGFGAVGAAWRPVSRATPGETWVTPARRLPVVPVPTRSRLRAATERTTLSGSARHAFPLGVHPMLQPCARVRRAGARARATGRSPGRPRCSLGVEPVPWQVRAAAGELDAAVRGRHWCSAGVRRHVARPLRGRSRDRQGGDRYVRRRRSAGREERATGERAPGGPAYATAEGRTWCAGAGRPSGRDGLAYATSRDQSRCPRGVERQGGPTCTSGRARDGRVTNRRRPTPSPHAAVEFGPCRRARTVHRPNSARRHELGGRGPHAHRDNTHRRPSWTATGRRAAQPCVVATARLRRPRRTRATPPARRSSAPMTRSGSVIFSLLR